MNKIVLLVEEQSALLKSGCHDVNQSAFTRIVSHDADIYYLALS
jgi:hypothetical protein